jgi:hypothetical protein
MPFIPRQVKPLARIAITCKLPQPVASLLKCYAEFLDSSQEYVVTETLQLAFRKDREFHAWLTTAHPEAAGALSDPSTIGRDHTGPAPGRLPATAAPATRTTTPAATAPAVSRPLASQER